MTQRDGIGMGVKGKQFTGWESDVYESCGQWLGMGHYSVAMQLSTAERASNRNGSKTTENDRKTADHWLQAKIFQGRKTTEESTVLDNAYVVDYSMTTDNSHVARCSPLYCILND